MVRSALRSPRTVPNRIAPTSASLRRPPRRRPARSHRRDLDGEQLCTGLPAAEHVDPPPLPDPVEEDPKTPSLPADNVFGRMITVSRPPPFATRTSRCVDLRLAVVPHADEGSPPRSMLLGDAYTAVDRDRIRRRTPASRAATPRSVPGRPRHGSTRAWPGSEAAAECTTDVRAGTELPHPCVVADVSGAP